MNREQGMRVTCKTDEVLETLRSNRETHAKMVHEARNGYLVKAENALRFKLDKIRAGKITRLVFDLYLPEDHTADYDTAIKMLEMHQGDTIELDAPDVRRFIQDKWDWAKAFYAHNSVYSAAVRSKGEDEGYL